MFIIRVYGILIEGNRLLVTDEYRLGMLMTKFPGGGLMYGEGPVECLIREWKEETGKDIRVVEHYYTTDFFQPSYNLPETHQILNIYYRVESSDPDLLVTTDKRYDFPELVDGAQTFRWLTLDEITEEDFTLPIDKVVASKLIQDLKSGHLIRKS